MTGGGGGANGKKTEVGGSGGVGEGREAEVGGLGGFGGVEKKFWLEGCM